MPVVDAVAGASSASAHTSVDPGTGTGAAVPEAHPTAVMVDQSFECVFFVSKCAVARSRAKNQIFQKIFITNS